MRALSLLLVLALVALVSAKSYDAHGYVSHWKKGLRVNGEHSVTMQFAVKQSESGLRTLKNLVDAVSDPRSPLYAQYATKSQLDEMLLDNNALSATLGYLHKHAATKISVKGSWIRATMKAKQVEKLFSTKVHHYTNRKTNKRVAKARAYTLPLELDAHVDFIGYLNYFPATKPSMVIRAHGKHKTGTVDPNGTVTPALLNQVYGITSNTVTNPGVTQGCFEDGQDLDPADLTAFQVAFGIPAQNISTIVGPNDPTACSDPNNCVEALLDFEYMMAVSQGAPTTFWAMDPNDQHPFMDWLINMTSDPNAPLVNSVSYGEVEQQVPADVTARFETAIQQVVARGITVAISSGDDGVANFPARTDPTQCGFFPSYPASSPYVTAVGATQGPESGSPEVACTSATGGIITSGGGFSTVWAQPSYQSSAVNTYLNSAAGSTLPPAGQFNASGRGYPDVAMLGYNYEIVVGGQTIPVSGTSASSPVFAAVIALVNNARLNAGKKSVGFANPALYQFAAKNPSIFNDITSGENNCAAQNQPQTCCQYGFTAVKGWDPVTGLGSVNFPALVSAFLALP